MKRFYALLFSSVFMQAGLAQDLITALKQGEQSYKQYCAACHQADGGGQVLGAPPLKKGFIYSSQMTTYPSSAPHIDLVLKGVPKTLMASFASLSDKVLADIITYERNAWGNHSQQYITPQDIAARRKAQTIDSLKDETYAALMQSGASNYQLYCARCHQLDGRGKAPHGPKLKGSFVARDADLQEYKIKEILQGAAGTRMRGYADQLNNQQLASIITYISNAWGNNINQQIIQPRMVQSARMKLAKATPDENKTYSLKTLMALGEPKYRAFCARCHLTTGLGGAQPGVPALKGSQLILKENVTKHIDIILTGVPGSIMRSFAGRLNNLELAAITTYERNAFGNQTGEAVQPSMVEPERVKLKETIDYQLQHQVEQQYIEDKKQGRL